MTGVTIHPAAQGTPEWLAARAGKLTGSRAADAIAFLKSGGEAAARRDYRMQLVCERLTGQPQEDGFVSPAMARGTEKEPAARGAYEAKTGNLVQEAGFLSRDDAPIGCSVDGHVDDWTGLIEAKCPKTTTHLGYLRSGRVPADYLPQILHNLWVTGAQWCDFVSFDDRLPAHLQLLVVRVDRNETAVQNYAAQARAFLAEVENELAALQGWGVLNDK